MYSMRFDMRAPDFGASPVELYEAAVDMCEWAETRGCLAAVICEHHSSPMSSAGCSPSGISADIDDHAHSRQCADREDRELPYPPCRFAAEIFTVHDLITGRRSRHAAAILGPPVVLHELVAVAVDPGLAVVSDTPESAKNSSAESEHESENYDPPQQLLPVAHRGMLSVSRRRQNDSGSR